jgi:hypothetical protein
MWNVIGTKRMKIFSKANAVPLLLEPGDSVPESANVLSNKNHGTAVLGVMIADNDTKGMTGISWGADIGLVPVVTTNLGYNPANAILLAVTDGQPGDVILLELQNPVCGLSRFGPSEWVSSVFDTIKTAVANGFVVVEAAGNGGVDLDQPACGATFDRSMRDSGAIIVGAGGPPGNAQFPDRERISSSTYGSRVDMQGWGVGVMTTGYGFDYTNPDDPTNPDFFYTFSFNATSAASAIAAGAAANLQGIALNHFGRPLRPLLLRQLLVSTGSPQLGDTTEHIGPRPDLTAAIEAMEPLIEVVIKPGSDPNAINPRSKGVILVVILTTDTFDAQGVDPATVAFGPGGAGIGHRSVHFEDVDGDGDLDLVLHFKTQDTGIACGDTEAPLSGATFAGAPITGSDSIVTVGCT